MKTLIKPTREDEDRYQLRTNSKFPISIERGRGCYVYDEKDNKYLDFYAGHAVTSTGHCHPRVVKAIQEQAERLIFYSNATYNMTRASAVKRLLEMAGPPYYQAFLVNSGSEANENAIKLARASTGRPEIISLSGSFHGRTYGSLSSTGISKYRDYLKAPVPGHLILSPAEAAEAVSENTAAVLIEPIQSMAGVQEIPKETLQEIHLACKLNNTLLIFDEIQTGIARTGSFLYAGRGDVYPDLVSLAKGIASGFPCGALLITEDLATTVRTGDLGSTFGGGPLACAALDATLEIIKTEKLAENAKRVGSYLREGLSRCERIEEVLGRGLLLGLKLRQGNTAKELQTMLFNKRIITGSSTDPQVLRLNPPLTLTNDQVDLLLEAMNW